MTHTRQWWVWVLGLGLCAAIGASACGSGSSGFDAAAAESAAISSAAQGGSCQSADGLVVCGSGAVAPPGPIAAGPAATILVAPGSGETVPCAAEGAADECSVEIRIAPSGFPPGTIFHGAYGLDRPDEPWVANDRSFSANGDAWLAVRLRLGGTTGLPAETGTKLRAAILVYPPDRVGLPFPIGGRMDLLSAFGGELAYVVVDLAVERTAP